MGVKTLAVMAAGLSLSFAVATSAVAAEKLMYTIKGGDSIPKSLTGKTGNAKNGRKLAINRKKGNCLACHAMPIPEQTFYGEVGPSLEGVAGRLSEGEMRLRLVNSKVLNPDTIMPAFYRKDGFTRVLKKFQGKTMLSAGQVEDIIAYLKTLK